MALLLAVAWHIQNYGRQTVSVPKRTYVSVPMAIIHAGGRPVFRDEDWIGSYQLKPLPVWDCARSFTSGMYRSAIRDNSGQMACVSFHASKILGDTQGGAILHDYPVADRWFRRARFDGRSEVLVPKDDTDLIVGWHCYISPDVATRLLWHMSVLPQHNDPLPNDDYPDLSTLECFK
jgi:dTDP-4-amino-4,6-dideoxygalactose transaminase